ncbi:[FeFe] hydrogenase H-cluster maturation GTPase HydF [Lachnoclostridium sp. An138]|uniref:[FeFe] hydrogenase H-cluster maturation GTPase HydF n=1 Tax=Lachnoclostridium sp. An138 TaxID=1965560 RepID=UPI000B3989D5|nr:[FeFe] hydrogenase H-cluster maturation GTPase HydF [Lachnoclostridium sp. An138]OUQ18009.1 [FeFe] hydrogenase H-cluster maturation GTPase HydF [Lachnoclostridium sp. An138]
MGMNQTPSSERVHIGLFGKRNAGKSSVINAVTNQDIAIVSAVRGTTTDPVYKSMELLPLGPVMLIDTPGLDDEGELGALRVQKGLDVLQKTDIALLIVDGTAGMSPEDERLEEELKKRRLPYLVVFNKWDLVQEKSAGEENSGAEPEDERHIRVSARTGEGIQELKERLARMVPAGKEKRLVGDLLEPQDLVVLVVPIDKAAPKGRLILPQQQTIRDVLESGAVSVVVREKELKETLKKLGTKPKLVITDSQVFGLVDRDTPEDILLTSFSILFARYKGNLAQAVRGAGALESLRDGDKILISEGCTHHRQCDDIGTVKLPRWIENYTGKKPEFVFTSGTGFERNLKEYHMIVHCGGCMLNEQEMQYRLKMAESQGVPMTNYGILIAYMKGILERSLQPFPDMAALLEKEKGK